MIYDEELIPAPHHATHDGYTKTGGEPFTSIFIYLSLDAWSAAGIKCSSIIITSGANFTDAGPLYLS